MNEKAKNQRKIGEIQMVSGDRPFPKTNENYLRVGCCSTTSPADSQDFPKTQGCFLHKIERKIRWPVGHDQPKNEKNGPDSWL